MKFLKKLIQSVNEIRGSNQNSQPDEPMVGLPNIRGYRLLRLLALGSASTVYVGESTDNFGGLPTKHAAVAIKVAKSCTENRSLICRRFSREADLVQRFAGPSIVRYLDSGTTETGEPFHVMELVQGLDLAKLSSTQGKLPDGRVLQILISLCQGLKVVHQAGVVHRDVKPSNIMLCRSVDTTSICKTIHVCEAAKLIDFGLAAEVNRSSDEQTKVLSGTPHYSAPEIWQQPNAVDFRSDIYSLGCCAYHLLAGAPPFSGGNPLEICSKHVRATPVALWHLNDSVARPLAELIMRCLLKKMDQRASSVTELEEDLVRIAPCCNWDHRDTQAWWDQNSPY